MNRTLSITVMGFDRKQWKRFILLPSRRVWGWGVAELG